LFIAFPHAIAAYVMIGGMKSSPKILPLRFVARQLRVPLRWLQNEADAGRIPHLNAGGQLLADPSLVEAALARRARTTGNRRRKRASAPWFRTALRLLLIIRLLLSLYRACPEPRIGDESGAVGAPAVRQR
jgi:hypothetical protein